MEQLDKLVRHVEYKYELLNANNQHKKWLNCVSSCTIRYQSFTQLKCSANLTIRDDTEINYYTDRLRVYIVLNGSQTLLGTFLLCSPIKKINTLGVITRDITAYSTLQVLLDDKITQTYQVTTSANIVNECIRLMGGSGLYDITASDKTLLSTKTYEIGTSKLDIINDLLATINYTSLYVDREGKFIAKPYVLPVDRDIDITIKNNIDGLVREEMTDSMDIFDIPNVFVRYTNDSEINPPLTYTYTNDNVNSPTSTVNRGRSIVDAKAVECTSLTDLANKAKSDALEANSKYQTVEFSMAIKPTMEFYLPCAYLQFRYVNDKYIIYNIEFNCSVGSQMKCKARKVVSLW